MLPNGLQAKNGFYVFKWFKKILWPQLTDVSLRAEHESSKVMQTVYSESQGGTEESQPLHWVNRESVYLWKNSLFAKYKLVTDNSLKIPSYSPSDKSQGNLPLNYKLTLFNHCKYTLINVFACVSLCVYIHVHIILTSWLKQRTRFTHFGVLQRVTPSKSLAKYPLFHSSCFARVCHRAAFCRKHTAHLEDIATRPSHVLPTTFQKPLDGFREMYNNG